MTGTKKSIGMWMASLTLVAATSVAWAGDTQQRSRVAPPSPPGLCPIGAGEGGGGQPDPLTVFNQYVELADQGLYLLRGEIKIASMSPANPDIRAEIAQPKQRVYLEVDLEAHPWLANKRRKSSPFYLVEGSVGFWRAYSGRYGELAAHARVQFRAGRDGEIRQVITLKPIPELSIFPRHY